MSYKGKYKPSYPQKYKGDPTNIIYRSLWERKFMVYCDNNERNGYSNNRNHYQRKNYGRNFDGDNYNNNDNYDKNNSKKFNNNNNSNNPERKMNKNKLFSNAIEKVTMSYKKEIPDSLKKK